MTKEILEELSQEAWEQSIDCRELSKPNLGYQELWKSGWKAGALAIEGALQKQLDAQVEMMNEAFERVSNATQEIAKVTA